MRLQREKPEAGEARLVAAMGKAAVTEALKGDNNNGGNRCPSTQRMLDAQSRSSALAWIHSPAFDWWHMLVGCDPSVIRTALLERVRYNQQREHPGRQVDWSTGLREPVAVPRTFDWEGNHS